MTSTSGEKPRTYKIEVRDKVWVEITNPREEAILDVLGGRNVAHVKLGMTRQSVHRILKDVDRVKDVESAEKIAKATADEGREVPAIELLGLAPWRGAERHDNDPRRGSRKRDDRHLTLVERESESESAPASSPDERELSYEPMPGETGMLRAGRRVAPPSRSARSWNRRALAATHLRLVGGAVSNG